MRLLFNLLGLCTSVVVGSGKQGKAKPEPRSTRQNRPRPGEQAYGPDPSIFRELFNDGFHAVKVIVADCGSSATDFIGTVRARCSFSRDPQRDGV